MAQRVAYIAGAGHSGSTVLSLALGGSPDAVALGEVASLFAEARRPASEQMQRPCSCGEDLRHCSLWGEVLLELGRPADAKVQFEKALARAPRRSLSLAGLARASKAAGDAESADKACGEIAVNYAAADLAVRESIGCN